MPLTAHDLRYHAEQSFPLLYAYLQRNAQRNLGSLRFDATEVDAVVGHVLEQLVRLGLLGCADKTPLNALDALTEAQFYAFLNHTVRNKAIDRLRKRHLLVTTTSELEASDTGESDRDNNPLDDAVESIWGVKPFDSPEEIALFLASQHETRCMLKHCILMLKNAPHQLEAVLQELRDVGATELLQELESEIATMQLNPTQLTHLSQQKDHAHKKLRHCLQQQSTHLIVIVALRLTEYGTRSTQETQETQKGQTATSVEYTVTIQTLAQQDLTIEDVRHALRQLVAERLLDWHDEETVRLSKEQMKHLARFYRAE
ncbi:MAG TPA: hypothetical protein DHW02_18705 [Ktedonobacter sp.]|nr:hypothetical protein [Ktedonobacter sp.]